MKSIKYIVLGLAFSILMASSGIDAVTYKEYVIVDVDVPGWNGVITAVDGEYTTGGTQYAQTTSTIDKVNQGSRSTSARVKATVHPTGYSSWVGIPNGAGYKSLGTFDSNIYALQLKENTWSALGFYWFGQWKLPE